MEWSRLGKKRDMPGGLWLKCENCHQMIFRKELEARHRVCPSCNFHFTLPARDRIEITVDPDSFEELYRDLVPQDRLKFVDQLPYPAKIQKAQEKSKQTEAIIAGTAMVKGRPVVMSVLDFGFMGGSMGEVVGRRSRAVAKWRSRPSARCSSSRRRAARGCMRGRFADADGEDLRRHRKAPTQQRILDLRDDQSHDGWRDRIVCFRVRHRPRRARSFDWVCRAARDLHHTQARVAEGIPARRVPPRERANRRDRLARPHARGPRAIVDLLPAPVPAARVAAGYIPRLRILGIPYRTSFAAPSRTRPTRGA